MHLTNRMNHPTRAEDIMNRHVRGLRGDTPATEAVTWLARHGYSGAPVIGEEGHVEGIFTEHDSVGALFSAVCENQPVGDVSAHMTKEVECVSPETDITDVALKFIKGKHRRIIVTVDGGRVVGLITRRDLIRGMLEMLNPKLSLKTYDILQQLRR